MQLSAEYYRKNAAKARELVGVVAFLEGKGSTLARALKRRAIRWERRAKEVEARYAQKS
jgi:hypothetical protein